MLSAVAGTISANGIGAYNADWTGRLTTLLVANYCWTGAGHVSPSSSYQRPSTDLSGAGEGSTPIAMH